MSDGRRILGVAGSLRDGSYNRALLAAAHELVPDGVAQFAAFARRIDYAPPSQPPVKPQRLSPVLSGSQARISRHGSPVQ